MKTLQNIIDAKIHIFDMDCTLYKDKERTMDRNYQACLKQFISETCNLTLEEVNQKDAEMVEKHKLNIIGWIKEEPKFNFRAWELFFENYYPFPEKLDFPEHLGAWIDALPGKKVVLTNAHNMYAVDLLKHMGLSDCFDAVYGVNLNAAHNGTFKPKPSAVSRILEAFEIDPQDAVMYDDSKGHLHALKGCSEDGITVTIGEKTEEDTHVDFAFEDIEALFTALYSK